MNFFDTGGFNASSTLVHAKHLCTQNLLASAWASAMMFASLNWQSLVLEEVRITPYPSSADLTPNRLSGTDLSRCLQHHYRPTALGAPSTWPVS